MMNKEFIQEMKQKLENELAELKTQLASVSSPDVGDHVPGERSPKFPNYGDDALNEDSESPAEVSDYSVNVSVTGTLESKLTAVQAALQRIEKGPYGQCVKCGQAITEERLRANPSADQCIHCAQAHV